MGGQQWPRCVMPTTPLPDSTKLKPLPVSKPRPKTDSRHKERAKKANSIQQHNTHREMMRAAPPQYPWSSIIAKLASYDRSRIACVPKIDCISVANNRSTTKRSVGSRVASIVSITLLVWWICCLRLRCRG